MRFVPVTAADSAIVKVSAAVGVSDPVTGVLAAPRLISSGNGTAHVRVLALLPDGFSVVAVDSVTETVRQVARHLGVEALRIVLTANDSVAIKPVARDARGAAIPDATITLTATGVPITGQAWVGPATGITVTTTGSITPALTGVSLPDSNPAAPQVAVTVDAAAITMLKPDTVVAGSNGARGHRYGVRHARTTGGWQVAALWNDVRSGARLRADRRDGGDKHHVDAAG